MWLGLTLIEQNCFHVIRLKSVEWCKFLAFIISFKLCKTSLRHEDTFAGHLKIFLSASVKDKRQKIRLLFCNRWLLLRQGINTAVDHFLNKNRAGRIWLSFKYKRNMISVVLHATRLSRQMSLTTAMISRQSIHHCFPAIFLSQQNYFCSYIVAGSECALYIFFYMSNSNHTERLRRNPSGNWMRLFIFCL